MVISIEVESTDGDEANRIARTWADLLLEWRNSENQRQRKEDRVDAALRDEPAYSQSWPPRLPIMAAAGAIFGLILAVVIIFALEWIEAGVVLTPQDLEQSAGVTVLGTIPHLDSKARPARRPHGEKI
jgi:capsular polysaccharide biosynthesis protein